MKSIKLLLIIFVCLFGIYSLEAQDDKKRYDISSEQKIITSEAGETIQVESGMFNIPESRKKDKGRTISIAYYRIKSKSKIPATPIFILAGGPGSSYLNLLHKEKYFNEVTFLSQFSDVVIFDQRGAGNSIPNLKCEGKAWIPLEDEINEANLKETLVNSSNDCIKFWESEGVNLSAYNTDENASDINDLRKALGYDKIIFSGGSYGSHLGLHTIRKYPQIIERAIFFGIEGPNHTWDVPNYLLNTLNRIATDIETNSSLQNDIPKGGLILALEEIVSRFESSSEKVTLTKGDQNLDALVNKMIIQKVASYKAGKRSDPLAWPHLIIDMYNGDYDIPAKASVGMHRISAPNAMKYAMDFSSGISEERKLQITSDKANMILGDLNLDYNILAEVWNVNDLGNAYRENITTDVPILLVHGNWDTSTPIENAYNILPTLKNGHLIEVEKGTHNVLYECYRLIEEFPDMIAQFIKGERVSFPKRLKLPAIEYPEPISEVQEQLWDACKVGDIEAVMIAVKNGADINALDQRGSKSGRRPLNWAAYYGHLDIINWLVLNEADINNQNNTGFTALHHAVETNNESAVKLLLELGADRNLKNKRSKTPLDIAQENDQQNIISILK
ncbi:alpha/beta fold hydrolase [Winogradskyella flava]|uniref:Alpha/beta fold hydrolase n=1 Tax=Winogradskyella flava TaxID=1884876 RepID=A0A842ISE6_9FLAO|nr:alpha/beta fold hydrolase [Winogradskyella flava]MBC2844736.1 alpha/beta fold hydrolase [Winogradskyella flava]